MDEFALRALIAGCGLALAMGPLGVFVVWRRMAYFGDTLAHSALLGVALGFALGVTPMAAVAVVCVGLALALLVLRRNRALAEDTLLGLLAHSSLSLGVVAIALVGAVRIDLVSYLFGDILAVSWSDIAWIYGGVGVVLVALGLLWRPFLALTVHEELARVEGVDALRTQVAFMVLIALVIALAMKLVGMLLVTALLILPAAAARRFAHTPEQMALGAAIMGCLSVAGGIGLSFAWNLPTGPAIVVASAGLFVLNSLPYRKGTSGMTKVYGNYTQEELDRQYEHRHIVPNLEEFTSRSQAESARIRGSLTSQLDVAYGPEPRQRVDIYPASGSATPVVVWLHGGRWSMGSKDQSCQPAETLTRAGVAFVAANFRQAPDHPMDTIVEDARRAVIWTHENAASFGADRNRLFVLGQSSGAHMGGMLATTDWAARGLPADLVKGAMLVSGMYDLEPVRLTFRNEFLHLDRESAARNSPIRHIPAKACPLVVGYGALESEEFKRQSREFGAAWRKAGHRCDTIEREGHHHYSLAPDINDPASPLVKSFLDVIGVKAKAAAAE